MQAGNLKLSTYIEQKNRIFVIPLYQRYYNWKEKQCERLFYDLINTIKFKNRHFLGAIVYKVEGNTNFQEHIIIDGQQRVTSATLLYLALYNIIKKDDKDYSNDEILYSYIKNKHPDDNKFKIKLHSIEKDRKVFNELLSNPNIEQKGNNIYDNYLTFKRLILENQEHSPKDIFKAMRNFDIVFIELEQNQNPQTIFESLNSKGLKLSQGDLIRNYLLMGLNYEVQKTLYKTYWEKCEQNIGVNYIDDFVRCYLTIQTGSFPKKENVYESFKTFLKEHNISIEDILKSLSDYSLYYSWCINRNSPYKKINELIGNFQDLKQHIVYALLISIFYRFDNTKDISQDSTIKIIQFIISYVYRRMVCGKTSNGLNNVIASLSTAFIKSTDEDKYEFITKNILSRVGSAAMPKDNEFESDFLNQNTRKLKSRYALETIEKHLHKEVVDFEDKQIEHIMPQKLTTKWKQHLGKNFENIHFKYLNNIGNLTLTGYNREMSNKFFNEKITWYENSNISITRKLVNYSEWNETSIQNRAKELFKIANEIWFYPSECLVQDIITNEEYNIMDEIDPTGYTPQKLRIANKNIAISTWTGMLMSLAEYFYVLDKEHFRENTLKKDSLKFISNDDIEKFPSSNFKEIKNSGIFINLHGSAITLLIYCKRICEAFELENDVSYILN